MVDAPEDVDAWRVPGPVETAPHRFCSSLRRRSAPRIPLIRKLERHAPTGFLARGSRRIRGPSRALRTQWLAWGRLPLADRVCAHRSQLQGQPQIRRQVPLLRSRLSPKASARIQPTRRIGAGGHGAGLPQQRFLAEVSPRCPGTAPPPGGRRGPRLGRPGSALAEPLCASGRGRGESRCRAQGDFPPRPRRPCVGFISEGLQIKVISRRRPGPGRDEAARRGPTEPAGDAGEATRRAQAPARSPR